jgi:hypothetical protein
VACDVPLEVRVGGRAPQRCDPPGRTFPLGPTRRTGSTGRTGKNGRARPTTHPTEEG